MRFSERAFLAGGDEVNQVRRDKSRIAQQSLNAAYQADDTAGIEDARRTLEGKSGILGLFQPEHDRGNKMVDPYSGESLNQMQGADVYGSLEQGFQGELQKAGKNNSLIQKAFDKYRHGVEKADRYYKNDRGGKLDVRNYLQRSCGRGKGGKLEGFYYGGRLLQFTKNELANDASMKKAFEKRYGIKYNKKMDFVPASKDKDTSLNREAYRKSKIKSKEDLKKAQQESDDYSAWTPWGKSRDELDLQLSTTQANAANRDIEYLNGQPGSPSYDTSNVAGSKNKKRNQQKKRKPWE